MPAPTDSDRVVECIRATEAMKLLKAKKNPRMIEGFKFLSKTALISSRLFSEWFSSQLF